MIFEEIEVENLSILLVHQDNFQRNIFYFFFFFFLSEASNEKVVFYIV